MMSIRESSRMGMVHLVPTIDREASGTTSAVKCLCDRLVQSGLDVTLLTLDAGPVVAMPRFVTPFPYGLGPRRIGRSPAMNTWLRQGALNGHIGLLHSHGMWMMPNVYPGQVARRFRIPLVVSPHGTFTEYAMSSGSWVKKVFWPLVQRPALTSVNCFHATCEAEYLDVRRLGFQQPVAIIPNGIDVVDYEPRSQHPIRTLLYLGRIHPEKGVETLLYSWARIEAKHPEWRLRIVGPGSAAYVAKLVQRAADLQLERCQFDAAAYGPAKWEAYRSADLYVLPSPSENFGMTVAEALASGRPAIATQGAPWRGLELEAAGFWPPYGVEPLAAALDHALGLPFEELAAMGRRGRHWMRRDFGWDAIGARMSEAYMWLLSRGPRPTCVIIE